ncbi:hypothetical protein Agub_g1678, partial [Astrephomene gubernaculifera]
MRTLLIDNYDSYTYNLFQVIAEVDGEIPLVCYNDKISLGQIVSMVEAGTIHSIVISPGPGTPSNPSDIGVCLDVLQHLPQVPILGICLGHQALALAHGAAVVAAPEPVHGRVSRLRHSGHKLFRDIPSGEGFEVVRYHSLLVDERSLPACLQPVCWTAGGHCAVKLARDEAAPAPAPAAAEGTPEGGDEHAAHEAGRPQQHQHHQQHGLQQPQTQQRHQQQDPSGVCSTSSPPSSLLMGLAHRSRPHYGVQFHPESVATRYGIALLRNFRDLAVRHIRQHGGPAAAQLPPARPVCDIAGPPGRLPALPAWPSPSHQAGAPLRLAWVRLRGLLARLPGGSEALFELLYGWGHDTWWLDSAASDRGRFSYMGGRGGPLWRKLTYKLPPPPQQQQQHQEQQQPQHPAADAQLSSSTASLPAALTAPPPPVPPTPLLEQPEGRTAGCTGAEEASQPPGPLSSPPSADAPASPPAALSAEPPRTCYHDQHQPHPQHHNQIATGRSCGTASAACSRGPSGTCGSSSTAGAGGGCSCRGGSSDGVAPCTPTSASCSSSSSSSAATVPSSSLALSSSSTSSSTSTAPQPHPTSRSPPTSTPPPPPLPPGTLTLETPDGRTTRHPAPSGLLAYLQHLLARQRLLVEPHAAAQLPFNFWGGLVGYLGYELKAECGAAHAHAATTPDAVLYLADRLVAVDHAEGEVFLLALYDSGEEEDREGEREGGRGQAGEEQARAWLQETQRRLEEAAEGVAAERCSGPGHGRSEPRPQAAEAAAGSCMQPGCQRSCSSHPADCTTSSSYSSNCCCCHPTPSSTAAPPTAAVTPQPQSPSCLLHPAQHPQAPATVTSATPPLPPASPLPAPPASSSRPVVPFRLAHGREAYLRNVGSCQAALHAGESYEVCLTTALTRPAALHPPQLYRTLRRLNPAPYAAWLQCGPAGPTICCSSPERFLRGDRGGLLEARPIKGTAARVAADPVADAAAAAELAASEKERAENLMIVDLLRNDLGRVCEIGSVHVPGLMDIESYATVHQMVSTVRGVRREGMSVVDCIRAAFPGGSMTGAPKVRTMHIIDALEGRARGVYSGCIGFISLNDTFDLNIVIRTAVIEGPEGAHAFQSTTTNPSPAVPAGAAEGPGDAPARSMTIGAGGAIVVQSQPVAEYEEMRLKASALLRAVG